MFICNGCKLFFPLDSPYDIYRMLCKSCTQKAARKAKMRIRDFLNSFENSPFSPSKLSTEEAEKIINEGRKRLSGR